LTGITQDKTGKRVHHLHLGGGVSVAGVRLAAIADIVIGVGHALSMADALVNFSPISGNFSQNSP
jgi:hypothetical protein